MNYFFPIIAAFLWSGNTVVTKLCAGQISPTEMSFYRWVLACLVLTPFVLPQVIKNFGNLKPNIPRIIVLGLLGSVIYQCLAYYAASYTTATKMGIIQSLYPLLALILGSVFLRHRATKATLLGGLVSAIGVVTVISGGHIESLVKNGLSIGDGLMLIATLAFATYSMLIHKWQMKLPLLQSVYLQAIVATVALLPLYLFSEKNHIGGEVIGYIAFAGIAASILAPLAWITGLGKLGAPRAAPFFNLVPVVTALLATQLLGETLSFAIVIGGALAIAGVIISESWRPKAQPVARQQRA